MGGRFVWWKTNLGTGVLILEADPGLIAGKDPTVDEAEAIVAVPGPAHSLDLAANSSPTTSQDEGLGLHQRESPNPTRNLVFASLTALPRAKSLGLAQTLTNHAPRAHQKSKQSSNPEVTPRRRHPVRGLVADLDLGLRAEMKNEPQNLQTVDIQSLQSRPQHPDPGLVLDHPHKIDSFCQNKNGLNQICDYI